MFVNAYSQLDAIPQAHELLEAFKFIFLTPDEVTRGRTLLPCHPTGVAAGVLEGNKSFAICIIVST